MLQQTTNSGVRRLLHPVSAPGGSVAMAVKLVLAAVLGCMVKDTSAYNVDTEGAFVYRGRNGSMFGFSVAQHIDQSTNWVLVGAPRAQTNQRNIERGGSVFRCGTHRVRSCQEIPFDRNGNNKARRGDEYVDIEDKSNQWFGATVRSSGENGVIVACAPRYVYFSRTFDKREPVGTCWVANGKTTEFQEFSPCRTEVERLGWVKDQYHRQGYCQTGFAASFSRDGSRLLITAVGSWYWQGQLYNYRLDDRSNYVFTREGPPSLDDSYMGYSSAVGDFDGDNVDDYLVGIPKGDQHRGLVAMFTQGFKNISNITGDQIGSYFGYSVAVTDLGADDLDDIIVGAPLFASYGSSNDYETGRVYIYYQNTKHRFRPNKMDILEGFQSRSRFGTAVSGLGDINYDGYNDLGVGAPYAGEDRKGAVYIYHGSKLGIITQVSQIIHARDVDRRLSTFGFSIAGGWDQDGNSYPDLVVGAYGSDRAVFLRTRPVVRVTASLKIEPKSIDLDLRSCTLVDNTTVACMTVYTCLEYTGIGVPEDLFFNVKWELDTLQKNKSGDQQRAYFLVADNLTMKNNTIKLTRKATWCTPSFAYVRNEPRDKLTPIAVDFSFALNDRKARGQLRPILDQYVPTLVRTEAHIAKECGPDNVCEPNLSVHSFRVSAAHIVGSHSELELLVLVENRGEGAYNAELYIYLPAKVTYRSIHGANTPPGLMVRCVAEEMESKEKYVQCSLGNPLPARAKTNFTLRVDPRATDGSVDQLIFTMEVNSTNIERFVDTTDNHASVAISVTAAADLHLSGKSDPEQIHLNTTEVRLHKLVEEKGKDIEHLYELRNVGPSDIETAEFSVYFPSHDASGKTILELDTPPEVTKGQATCHKIVLRPENTTESVRTYKPGKEGDISVELQEQRELRPLSERGKDIDYIQCTERWCTIWRCIVGTMKQEDNVLINFKAKLFIGPIVRREGFSKHLIVTEGRSQILTMPYNLSSLDVNLLASPTYRVVTVINTDRLPPVSRPIEIWVIAVSVAAGLLVLLLIIVLLWWCGFFKRKKPEDEGYMIANGNPKMDIDNKTWD